MSQSVASHSSPVDADQSLALVVERLTERLQAGERVDPAAVALEHPEYAEQLQQLWPALEAMANLSNAPPRDFAGGCTGSTSGEEAYGTLGDYAIHREVGRGGMGVVYEAVQISLGRRVALKVLPFAATMDKRQLQRFHNEARAAASLEHANIVPVYGVGTERGVHYYAMRFIEGQSLEALLQSLRQGQQPPSPPETGAILAEPKAANTAEAKGAARSGDTAREPRGQGSSLKSSKRGRDDWRRLATLALQAAEALEHAHQSGVVHRDVKPANLLLDENGKLWITDFGLAHIQSDTRLTITGDLVGTLRYMSPEQALAKRIIVDHRTDIYSLGATFYEVMTLKPVFAGQDRQELLRQIAFEEPVAPRRLDRTIPVELETVILKSLEKNPADRYGTAREMADDLKRFLNDEPTLARRPTVWKRVRKWSRRHVAAVRAVTIAAVLVVAALTGMAGVWWGERANRERETQRAVVAVLQEADRLQKERKVPEALEKVKLAEVILASGTATAALKERVLERLDDLKLVAELEDILANLATDVTMARHQFVVGKPFRGSTLRVTKPQPL